MNITRENSDELNAVLKLELTKEDYTDRVDAVLKDYRKKANIPGFRPGKVPAGMIKKMYGKPVLVEEINKLVSESLSKYLMDEKLNVLGEPLPYSGDDVKPIDFDNDEVFEFKFDLGLAPEVDVKLSAKDKVPYYTIKVDDELINKMSDNYTQRAGEFVHVDTIEEKDVLSTKIVQLDEKGEVLEGGIFVEEARMSIDLIKDDAIREAVLKLKNGDDIVMDIKKAFPNDTEIAALLKVKPDEAADISGDFKVTVIQIQRFNKAEVNQEFFDKTFGEGVVNSEEEFHAKLAEEAASGLKRDSDYKFRIDAKESLVKKFKKDLPIEFLKRWLLAANEGKFTAEEIDKDFDKFLEDLKWQLIKDKLMKENEITVTEEDLKAAAIDNARMQFAYYGMNNVPDEHLEQFAQRTFENQEEMRKLQEEKVEEKVIAFIRGNIKVDEKEITQEKFNKFFEDKK